MLGTSKEGEWVGWRAGRWLELGEWGAGRLEGERLRASVRGSAVRLHLMV